MSKYTLATVLICAHHSDVPILLYTQTSASKVQKIDRERLYGVRKTSEYENASSKYIFTPLSRALSLFVVRLPVTPNQVTIFWGLLMIASSLLLMSGDRILSTIGGIGWIIAYALDYTDGDIARYKDMRSRRGGFQDRVNHRATYPLLMFCAGFGVWVIGGAGFFNISIDPAAYLILGFTAGLGMVIITELGDIYNISCPETALESDKGTAAVEGKLFKNQKLFRVIMNFNPLTFTNMKILLPIFAVLDLMNVFVIFYGIFYPMAAFARYVMLYRMVPGVVKK